MTLHTPEPRRRDIFDTLDAVEREHGLDLRRLGQTPAAADEFRARMAQRLVLDPLLKQFAQRQHRDWRHGADPHTGPPITEPWMALGEQRMWALAAAGTTTRFQFFDAQDPVPETIKRARLLALLTLAQTFVWSPQVWATVSACPMPPHVVARDILPFPFTYHSMESAMEVIQVTNPDWMVDLPPNPVCDWMAVADVPNHSQAATYMQINSFGRARDTGVGIVINPLQFGVQFPDAFPPAALAGINQLLSMFAFLKSPYVEVTAQKLPRAWRRHGGVAPGDDTRTVSVVTLRAAAQDAVAHYEAESTSWKHRWWVRAHYRRQWHPSTQTHEVIWIAPHLKGPEDAPMLDKVYAVTR